MRKWIYFSLIIIILILGLIPLAEGYIFKKRYLELIEFINHDNRVKIEVLKYDEGWFHSYARIRVSLNQGLANFYQVAISKGATTAVPIEFVVVENISHGPIIYDDIAKTVQWGNAKVQIDLYLSRKLNAIVFGDETKRKAIFQFELLSVFGGDWLGTVYIPDMNFTMNEMGKVSWGGLEGKFKLVFKGDELHHAKAQVKIGPIHFQSDAQNAYFKQITIQPIKYRYDVAEKEGLLSGNSGIYTSGILSNTDQGEMKVDKFAVNTAFGMDKQTLYNTNIGMNIKTIRLSPYSLPDISPFHFLLSAANFSTHGLREYLNSFNTNNPETMRNIDIKAMEALMVHMITPGSNINGQMDLTTSSGSLTCFYKISWRSDVPAPNTFSDIIASADTEIHIILSPALAAKMIELYNGNISITSTPEEKSATIEHRSIDNSSVGTQSNTESPQQELDDLLLGGFINKDDNNNYTSTLTIKSGVWRMNEKPVYYH